MYKLGFCGLLVMFSFVGIVQKCSGGLRVPLCVGGICFHKPQFICGKIIYGTGKCGCGWINEIVQGVCSVLN